MTSTYTTSEENKINNRVTISLDDECFNMVKSMKKKTRISQSEIFRKALKFYNEYGELFQNNENFDNEIKIYIDMLRDGEHIILDVDHYLLILKFIEECSDSPKLKEFWEVHKRIAKNHAEQFKESIKSFDAVIKRLETCNFFKIIKKSSNQYTLLLGSDIPKKFVRTLLLEIFKGMGFMNIEIKQSFAKLKIYLNIKKT